MACLFVVLGAVAFSSAGAWWTLGVKHHQDRAWYDSEWNDSDQGVAAQSLILAAGKPIESVEWPGVSFHAVHVPVLRIAGWQAPMELDLDDQTTPSELFAMLRASVATGKVVAFTAYTSLLIVCGVLAWFLSNGSVLAGLCAASTVAVAPSVLLHVSALRPDTYAVTLTLAGVLAAFAWFRREQEGPTPKRSLWLGGIGAILAAGWLSKLIGLPVSILVVLLVLAYSDRSSETPERGLASRFALVLLSGVAIPWWALDKPGGMTWATTGYGLHQMRDGGFAIWAASLWISLSGIMLTAHIIARSAKESFAARLVSRADRAAFALLSLAVGAALVLLVVPVFYSGSFEQWVESTNRTVWASVSRTVFPRWIVGIEPFALQVSKSWAHLQKSHTLIFHLNPLWLWVPTLFVAAWGAWRFKSLARLMCFGILCTAAIFPILLFLTAYRRPDYIYSFYSVYFIPPVAVSFAALLGLLPSLGPSPAKSPVLSRLVATIPVGILTSCIVINLMTAFTWGEPRAQTFSPKVTWQVMRSFAPGLFSHAKLQALSHLHPEEWPMDNAK